MVKEVIIPKENIAKVEEVRYLENAEQKREKKLTVAEIVKKAFIPAVHASDDGYDAHTEYVDTAREARRYNRDTCRRMRADETREICNIL